MRALVLVLVAGCWSFENDAPGYEVRDVWGNEVDGPYAVGSELRIRASTDDAPAMRSSNPETVRVEGPGLASVLGVGTATLSFSVGGERVPVRVRDPDSFTIDDDTRRPSGGIWGNAPLERDVLHVHVGGVLLLHARYFTGTTRVWGDRALRVESDAFVEPSPFAPQANEWVVRTVEPREHTLVLRVGDATHELQVFSYDDPDELRVEEAYPYELDAGFTKRLVAVASRAGMELDGVSWVEWFEGDTSLGTGTSLLVAEHSTLGRSATIRARSDDLEVEMVVEMVHRLRAVTF